MSTMNISLPDEMRAWVETEVSQGGYGNASEYFRQLLREAKARKEAEARQEKQSRLEALLLEGIKAGEGEAVTPQWWADFRAEMEEELEKRRRSQGQNGKQKT